MIQPSAILSSSFRLGVKSTITVLLVAFMTAPGYGLRGVQQQKEEPLKLQSDLVIVNASVIDPGGQDIKGISASDFHITEDGTPQKIDSFVAEEAPFAAAILIDMSGSMGYKFGLVRAAAASFLDHIRAGDVVAVYGFNTKVRQFQDFSESHDISDYVWDAEANDSTRLYDCMDTAIDALGKRQETRRALLVITDGCDNLSKATMNSVLKKAQSNAVTIFSVDLTDDELLRSSNSGSQELRRGRGELQQFAGDTGGTYIHSPEGDSLDASFEKIVEELRNQYTLTYYSTNAKHDGRWRKISATVSWPRVTVRTRKGYYAPKG